MISPGAAARSFVVAAAAALCSVVHSGNAAAQEDFVPGGEAEESAPRTPRSAFPVRAAAPSVERWELIQTGDVYEEFDVRITWSEDVEDFELNDIRVDDGDATRLTGSDDRYTLTIEPDEVDGYVTVTIRANGVDDFDGDSNAEQEERFRIDNLRPEFEDATVDGDELVIIYDEDLDERRVSVPSPVDFEVEADGDDVEVEDVQVEGAEVILTLASSVLADDVVRVTYEHGAAPLQDEVGNLAEELRRERVDNITDQAAGTPPGPPRSLTANADGASVIELDWQEPTDAGDDDITGYRIEYSRDAGGTWQTLEDDTDDTGTSYRDIRLSPGTTRHYRVAAINRHGRGDWSNEASATTKDVLPDAPRSFTARARGDSAIELNWRIPSSSGSGPITGYRIEWSRTGSGGWGPLADTGPTTTTYTDGGLRPVTTRYYRVAAMSAAGLGEWSRVDQATTESTRPSAPIGLSVVPGARRTDQLLLTWSAPADDGGSPITGYRIERSTSRGGGWIIHVASTGSAATIYTDSNLGPATTWFYRVSAINSRGASSLSNVAEGTTDAASPGQPQNVRARGTGPNSVLLAWDPPESDGGARVTGYSIRMLGPNDNSWIIIRPNTGTTTTTFTQAGLDPVTRYQYQVAAINRVGAGAWSLTAATLTHADFAGAPTGLTAQAVGTSRIDLAWNAPRYTGGVSILGYRVEASDDGGATWNIIRRNTNSMTTAFSDVNLRPATTRHYRVAAINLAGLGPFSNTSRATTDATLPGVPRSLNAQASGTSQIILTWRVPADDGGANVTGYRIEASDDGGATWQDLMANTRTTTTTYSHTGLEPATTRYYRVSAVNRIGAGQASRVASATTDATVPDAPTSLTATATTPTRIDLAWTAPAYDGGAPITGYRIEVSETGAAWTDLVRNTESTATTFSHTDLKPGSVRHYRVSAINLAGTGAASASASAATDDPVQRAGRLNTRVLPHVAAAMTSSTVSAIASRVDAVANGMGMERSVEANGLSSMAASLSAPGASPLGLGQRDGAGLAALFGGTSFTMPLGNTTPGDADTPTRFGVGTPRQPGDAPNTPQQSATGMQMATWGAGEYHHLGEPGASALDWNGNMVSAHMGVDARIGSDLLAGVAGSYNSGSFDFTDKTGARPVTGTYGATMTSAHPYVAWFPGTRGTSVWGSAGIGRGDIEVNDEREGLRTSPASTMTGAAGGSYQLLTSGIGGVRLKAEGWTGRFEVEGAERIEAVTLEMQRAKLALELTQGFRTDTGHEVAFVLEGGMRYDDGDGVNGASGEVGGGLRYTNSRVGMIAEGRGRFVLSARDGYEEWGFGGMLQFDPAVRGQGLSIRVAPSWGDAASGVNQLWERGVSDAVRGHGPDGTANIDGEISYGIASLSGTPYGGFHLGERGLRAFSSGVRYDLGSGLGLRLEATRRESALRDAAHTVGIRGRIKLR